MAEIQIAPITARYAADILSWRYPTPYDCYNMADGDPGYYLDPVNGMFAVLSGDELIGFRSFGPDGRVPGGAYDDSALDTGGGLRPELTGRGSGAR
jgi:[ribosomal protein S18]-alanine N-acetyltransferase